MGSGERAEDEGEGLEGERGRGCSQAGKKIFFLKEPNRKEKRAGL